MIGFSFHEVMEGTLEMARDRIPRRVRFSLDVRFPELRDVVTSAVGEAVGTMCVEGIATDVPTSGSLELAPLAKRRVGYALRFRGDDGKQYALNAEKTIGGFAFTRGWTEMPGVLEEASGAVVGSAVIRFSRRGHLAALVSSMRLTPSWHREGAKAV